MGKYQGGLARAKLVLEVTAGQTTDHKSICDHLCGIINDSKDLNKTRNKAAMIKMGKRMILHSNKGIQTYFIH